MFKLKVIEWAERHDVSALRLKRAEFRREEAAIGLRLLSSKAMPAVPALVELLQDTNVGAFAAYALAGITNASQEWTGEELLGGVSLTKVRTNSSRKPSPPPALPNPYE